MKKLICCFCFIILALFNFNSIANPHKLFEEANGYYTKENYSKAISVYKELINLGYISSELYFNIGNAYFKTDSLASAILWYERAKLLNPSDKAINANLKIANSRTTDKIEPLPKMFIANVSTKILSYFSLNVWTLLVVFSSLATCLLFYFYLRSLQPIRKKLFFFSSLALFFVFIVLLISSMAALKQNDKTHLKKAIVFSDYVNVKSAPTESSVNLFVLHEGAAVYIKEEVNGWINVSIENGNEGWLIKSSVRNI